VKYAFIATQRQQFPIALMCRLLGVSRSGFYAAHKRQPSARALTDQRLRVQICAVHRQSRHTYGSPRVHAELREQGVRCGRKRVERLMRAAGLQAKQPRRTRRTTNSQHAHAIAPNLVDRRFAVTEVRGLDRVWTGDITYVPTREGWLYLAVLLDLASRRVVGWAMQPTLEQSLTHAALQMAVLQRHPLPGVVHHSDRGVQYAATDYQALLRTHKMTPSMSRKGDCYDNAVVESFFATLEWELIAEADWHTRAEARTAIFEYIEVWYNQQRRHSALGYVSPSAYEAQRATTARAA
jgi:transposase InsO family protein